MNYTRGETSARGAALLVICLASMLQAQTDPGVGAENPSPFTSDLTLREKNARNFAASPDNRVELEELLADWISLEPIAVKPNEDAEEENKEVPTADDLLLRLESRFNQALAVGCALWIAPHHLCVPEGSRVPDDLDTYDLADLYERAREDLTILAAASADHRVRVHVELHYSPQLNNFFADLQYEEWQKLRADVQETKVTYDRASMIASGVAGVSAAGLKTYRNYANARAVHLFHLEQVRLGFMTSEGGFLFHPRTRLPIAATPADALRIADDVWARLVHDPAFAKLTVSYRGVPILVRYIPPELLPAIAADVRAKIAPILTTKSGALPKLDFRFFGPSGEVALTAQQNALLKQAVEKALPDVVRSRLQVDPRAFIQVEKQLQIAAAVKKIPPTLSREVSKELAINSRLPAAPRPMVQQTFARRTVGRFQQWTQWTKRQLQRVLPTRTPNRATAIVRGRPYNGQVLRGVLGKAGMVAGTISVLYFAISPFLSPDPDAVVPPSMISLAPTDLKVVDVRDREIFLDTPYFLRIQEDLSERTLTELPEEPMDEAEVDFHCMPGQYCVFQYEFPTVIQEEIYDVLLDLRSTG